jgi:hypothetical protein
MGCVDGVTSISRSPHVGIMIPVTTVHERLYQMLMNFWSYELY